MFPAVEKEIGCQGEWTGRILSISIDRISQEDVDMVEEILEAVNAAGQTKQRSATA